MTTVVYGVQAKSPAPLFRVVGGAAVSSYRPVSGLLGQALLKQALLKQTLLKQECARFSDPTTAELSGLTGYVGGVRLAEHVLAGQTERREVLLARIGGTDGFKNTFSDNDGSFSDNGSTDGGNGTQPMSPWGYRTSSPPG